jgi:hypothetical protein
MAADDQPAAHSQSRGVSRGLARRVARRAAAPVIDPINRRFDAIETRLDECTRLLLEVRDRVEADLASIVELTIELQRALEMTKNERHREHNDATTP